MDDRFLTPQISREVIRLLMQKRGWSVPRLARCLGASTDFVRRVQTGKQSLETRDIEALANANGQKTYMLLFDAIPMEKLPSALRGLYELTQKEIERHAEFSRVMARKTTKKRRARTKAA